MPEKDSKDSFYYLNAYQDGITPGQKMTIQHNISFNDWRAGPHIAPLVTLTSAEVTQRKEASITLEKELYAQLKKLAAAWDEQAAQTMLLERALEGRSAPARLLEFSSGDALLGWMDRHAGELDLVFLDIEMEGTNGMDTARALREADQSLQLVFVTGYSDYVFDGYEVGALGYLLKPAGAEELERVLTRALTALQRQEEELFFCRSGEVFYRIRRDAILYFRSDRRQVTCVTPRRAYIFYGKLDQVAAQLGAEFVRIHQRYLVRAGAVDRVTGSEVWVGEEILPISRSCQREALLALTRAALE